MRTMRNGVGGLGRRASHSGCIDSSNILTSGQDAQLAKIHRTFAYPKSYGILEIDGAETSDFFGPTVAPGTHTIRWMRTSLSGCELDGYVVAHLRASRDYKVGVRDTSRKGDVSIWDVHTGEIVSTPLSRHFPACTPSP